MILRSDSDGEPFSVRAEGVPLDAGIVCQLSTNSAGVCIQNPDALPILRSDGKKSAIWAESEP